MVARLISLVVVACAVVAGAPSAFADEPTGSYSIRAVCPTALSPSDTKRGGWFGAAFPAGADLRAAIGTCGSDGVFGLDLTTGWTAPSSGVSWSFLAPEGTKIDRVRFERRIRVSQGYRYALDTSGLGTREYRMPGSVSFPAPPTEWTQGAFELYSGTYLLATLACVDPAGCMPTAEQAVSIRGFEADLVDQAAPAIQYAITTDQAPPTPPSTFAVDVDVADKGSGVKTTVVLVDGVAIGAASGGGTCAASPYTLAAPCPATAHLSVPIARELLERGTGVLEVEAVDAGGNRVRTPAVGLWKFGYASVSSTPSPDQPGVLAVGFKGTTKTKLRSRYSAPPTITGTVRSTIGDPLPGVSVRIDTRVLVRDAVFAPLTTVRTDKHGAFALRLPRGPSREIQATVVTSSTASATLTTSVAAPVRLRANRKSTRNRRTVAFAGTVPGTPKGARTRIDLQAWAGGHWLTFASPTLKNGHFGAKYTFTRTFTPSTYRFRAVLRADDDFPYAAGRSREIRVHVRP